MHFDTRDIRLYMDVYTADNVFLGDVRQIERQPVASQGKQIGEAAQQASKISGELLGPMPTEPIGNSAPRAQGANRSYGVAPDDAEQIGQGTLTVAKWFGLVGRQRIPLDAVQTVSLEKVVLRLKEADLT